ncbi:MAG: hypothetical protein IPL61_38355 [Myxococcales bacterium]|nr:hypothetical protein [Myxococcales bacterium]
MAAKANGKPLDWRKLDRSDLEDRQVWGVIASQLNWDPQATMTVVADACYGKGLGPMKMRFGDFEQWLEQFAERYNDEVFGGDAVLLCEEGLVVVHHEGIFAILLKAFVIG